MCSGMGVKGEWNHKSLMSETKSWCLRDDLIYSGECVKRCKADSQSEMINIEVDMGGGRRIVWKKNANAAKPQSSAR